MSGRPRSSPCGSRTPKALIPGNKMVFVGLKKPDDVANLVAYLETLK